MTPLIIARLNDAHSCPGDFCVTVSLDKNTLFLPGDIIDALATAQRDWVVKPGDNALRFLSNAYAFPTAMAHYLNLAGMNWTADQAKAAAESLANSLVGANLLDSRFVQPPEPRAYGALHPAILDPKVQQFLNPGKGGPKP